MKLLRFGLFIVFTYFHIELVLLKGLFFPGPFPMCSVGSSNGTWLMPSIVSSREIFVNNLNYKGLCTNPIQLILPQLFPNTIM